MRRFWDPFPNGKYVSKVKRRDLKGTLVPFAIAIAFALVIVEILVPQSKIGITRRVHRSILITRHAFLSSNQSATTGGSARIQVQCPAFLLNRKLVILKLSAKSAQH